MAKNGLQGALDLLILKTLSQLESMYGYGIIMHVRRVTDELLTVEEGSLYPALRRMEQKGWVRSRWAVTDYGRKAKWYALTRAGQKELSSREKNFYEVIDGICPKDSAAEKASIEYQHYPELREQNSRTATTIHKWAFSQKGMDENPNACFAEVHDRGDAIRCS